MVVCDRSAVEVFEKKKIYGGQEGSPLCSERVLTGLAGALRTPELPERKARMTVHSLRFCCQCPWMLPDLSQTSGGDVRRNIVLKGGTRAAKLEVHARIAYSTYSGQSC